MNTAEIQLNDPQTLYRRWEDSQWSPFAIDLSQDSRQWREMTGEDRELIFYVLSSLMVDEARHMQFYARFQDEVISAPAAIAAHIERARGTVSDAFRHIFDEELVEAHRRLVAEPGSLAAKVRFVTLYHLILESTLGLTTFNFTTAYLIGEGLLRGFVERYSKNPHDP